MTNEQQAEQDPRVQEWTEASMAQESEEAMMATMAHLQRRVVALGVEVRSRDARIADLERQVATLEGNAGKVQGPPQ